MVSMGPSVSGDSRLELVGCHNPDREQKQQPAAIWLSGAGGRKEQESESCLLKVLGGSEKTYFFRRAVIFQGAMQY